MNITVDVSLGEFLDKLTILQIKSDRIGDATWHMDGVRLVRGKDAPWVTEDEGAVLDQLGWLNQLARTAPESAKR